MDKITFSELIAEISGALSDKSGEELAEIAKHILDKEISYQGDGNFIIS